MEENKPVLFSQMGLDERLVSAINRLKWLEPTPVQAVAIPYFLGGKDVLAKARTGSGKTGAYLVPMIQKILEFKANSLVQATTALIVAPSKELCKQISDVLQNLLILIKRYVLFVDLSPKDSENTQKTLLLGKPDIVIGTPTRILTHINQKNLCVEKDLQFLIIDEADLISTYEHSNEMESILKHIPQTHQSFLTSATLGENVYKLKKLALNKPKILKLEEPPLPTAAQLQQYVIKLEERDKIVFLLSCFQLNHIRGKTIIFVKAVDKAYRLRLFLDQFNIKSCVLNADMPVASRCNIIDQFNSGLYNVIIAADEKSVPNTQKDSKKNDKESGAARGIDFAFVSSIVNFDFPPTVDGYIHRVGRAARGTNMGTALSLVSRKERHCFQKVEEALRELMEVSGYVLNPFKYDLAQMDGFRYRASEAWKRCTKFAVAKFRKQEIKKELLNSDQLRRHFQEKPQDLEVLRHDVSGKILKNMEHLKNVPEYNIPARLRPTITKKTKIEVKQKERQRKSDKRGKDPLRRVNFSSLKKKKTKKN